MAYCRKCGQKNPDGAAFCINCGSPLRSVGFEGSHEPTEKSLYEEPAFNEESANNEEPPRMEQTPRMVNGKAIKIAIAVVGVILVLWLAKSLLSSGGSVEKKVPTTEITPPKTVITDETETIQDEETNEAEHNQEIEPEPVVEPEPVKGYIEETVEEYEKERFTGPVYDKADNLPTFPGGYSAMQKYLRESIVYPESARKDETEGIVILSFVVEPDGSLSNIKVDSTVDPEIDKEAIRIVKNMPRWKPGKKGKKSVRVKYELPISFKLNLL